MRNRIILLFPFLFFISCKHQESRLHYTCDVDALVPWTDHATFKRMPAHTGNYISLADSAFPYCVGFKKEFSEITEGKIMKAEISAWVKYIGETEGRFVCAVDSLPGKSCVYLDEVIHYNLSRNGEWQKVNAEFFLPMYLKPEYEIHLFIWKTQPGELAADDIEINFTEY